MSTFKVDIFLREYYWDIVGDQVIRGLGPTAVQSKIGYLIFGWLDNSNDTIKQSVLNLHISVEEKLSVSGSLKHSESSQIWNHQKLLKHIIRKLWIFEMENTQRDYRGVSHPHLSSTFKQKRIRKRYEELSRAQLKRDQMDSNSIHESFRISWTGNSPRRFRLLKSTIRVIKFPILAFSKTPFEMAYHSGSTNFIKELLSKQNYVRKPFSWGRRLNFCCGANIAAKYVKEIDHNTHVFYPIRRQKRKNCAHQCLHQLRTEHRSDPAVRGSITPHRSAPIQTPRKK